MARSNDFRFKAISAGVLFIVVSSAMAQQFPLSSGGCGVSSTGIEGCSWMTGVPTADNVVGGKALFVTTYVLAPNAPLRIPVPVSTT